MGAFQAPKATEMVAGCLNELPMIRATNDNLRGAIYIVRIRIIINFAMHVSRLGYKLMLRQLS